MSANGPIRLHDSVIFVTGDCYVEDAETLFGLLREGPQRRVDLTRCGHLHAAVWQVLMAWAPQLEGPAADAFVRDRLVGAGG